MGSTQAGLRIEVADLDLDLRPRQLRDDACCWHNLFRMDALAITVPEARRSWL